MLRGCVLVIRDLEPKARIRRDRTVDLRVQRPKVRLRIAQAALQNVLGRIAPARHLLGGGLVLLSLAGALGNELTKAEFQAQVKDSGKNAFVKFLAPW